MDFVPPSQSHFNVLTSGDYWNRVQDIGRRLKVGIQKDTNDPVLHLSGDKKDDLFCACEQLKQLSDSISKLLKPKPLVVIDGENVCMAHGRDKDFSSHGLLLAIRYFQDLGHKHVKAFVLNEKVDCPADSKRLKYPVLNQEILKQLIEEGVLVKLPTKKLANGQIRRPYDDIEVVRYAFENNGVLVSNDNMLDLMVDHPEWRETIEHRFTFYFPDENTFCVVNDS